MSLQIFIINIAEVNSYYQSTFIMNLVYYYIYSLLLLRKSDYYDYLFMKDNKQSHGLMRVTL